MLKFLTSCLLNVKLLIARLKFNFLLSKHKQLIRLALEKLFTPKSNISYSKLNNNKLHYTLKNKNKEYIL